MKRIADFLHKNLKSFYIGRLVWLYSFGNQREACEEYDIASFDVYDTCVTRLTGKPESLFRLLAHRIDLPADARKSFANLRVQAEREAYTLNQAKTNLDDIYQRLGILSSLSSEALRLARDEEISLEKKLAVPIPQASAAIHEERKKGKRLAFVSDMYLPGEVIRDILNSARMLKEEDILLVSCEEGCDKKSGLLFQTLKERADVGGEKIFHRGDNAKADFIGARKARCRAVLERPAELNRYEEIMERQSAATEGFSSLLAGISRAVRLAHTGDGGYDQNIVKVVAGVAAPVLIAYVYWILREALRMDLRTLYFISRDGEILLSIAECLTAIFQEFSWIELRYLYGSRHAWYPPSLKTKEDLENAFSSWLFEGRAERNLETFFSRLNIGIKEIEELLKKFGLWELALKKYMSLTDKTKLRGFLSQPEVLSFVLERASQYRARVLAYLRQEGLGANTGWGCVDLGWRGRLQQKLSDFVREIGGCPPRGFYFALNSRPRFGGCGEYHTFLPTEDFISREAHNFLEVLCSGSHGTVLEYGEDEAGTLAPLLREEKNNAFHRWGMDCYRGAVMEFCALLRREAIHGQPWIFDKNMLLSLIDSFWLSPSREEVEVWGSLEFSDDQREKNLTPLAGRLRFQNIAGEFFPLSHSCRLKALWVAGTLARSPFILRHTYALVHWFIRGLKSFLRKRLGMEKFFRPDSRGGKKDWRR